MKKNLLGKILFSDTWETINSWTDMGGYYKLLWVIEIFGIRIVIWKASGVSIEDSNNQTNVTE